MLQGLDVKRRSDGGYTITLQCVVCGAAVGPLDYLAFRPPATDGVETGMLCHKNCCNGRVRNLLRSGDMAMLRIDAMAEQFAMVLDAANRTIEGSGNHLCRERITEIPRAASLSTGHHEKVGKFA
jgi:hypothetical protein